MTTFLSLFIVLDIVYMAYMLSRPAATRRKMQQEKERQAAERQAKAETCKREKAAAKTSKPARTAAQPPRKRGRPRKNPPKQPAAPRQQAKPAAQVLADPHPVNSAPKKGAFAGETVAFTGTCPKMERRYMVSHVNRLGGQGYETINTRCTLLVVAENPGKNQLDKAARWHIPTITWEEWWERAFNYPAYVKPQPAEDDTMTLDQFASMTHNAA